MAERKTLIPIRARTALVLAVAGGLVLAGCSNNSDRVFFNGNYYPAKAKRDKDTDKGFVVTVQRISKGLDGAREAGRYEGTRYCIKTFGTSEIDWVRGPDAEDGTLQVSGSRLVLSGKCVTW